MRYPLADLARALGVNPDLIHWHLKQRHGIHQVADDTVNQKRAYDLCDRIGIHPFTVWPEMVDHIDIDLVECARLRCTNEFVRTHPQQRYCCTQCGQSARNARYKRRRYQQDPAFRAKLLEENSDYRASIDDAARARRYRRRTA